MILKPYKHPIMGWCFDWKLIAMLDNCFFVGPDYNWLAIRWNNKQPLRLKPRKIAGRVWGDGDKEPNMYIWLRFNISFAGGWGIGMTYK